MALFPTLPLTDTEETKQYGVRVGSARLDKRTLGPRMVLPAPDRGRIACVVAPSLTGDRCYALISCFGTTRELQPSPRTVASNDPCGNGRLG